MIAVNTFYVTNKIDELLLLCEAIKIDSSANAIKELITAWENCRDIIALSVHRLDLERAETALLALDKYYGLKPDFTYQLSILEAALKHIGDNQRFTLDSIF